MRKPGWSRDHGGWSGGWYPSRDEGWELSVLYVRVHSLSFTVATPATGDLTLGYMTRYGRKSPYHRYGDPGWLVFEWRSWRQLQEDDALAKAKTEAMARRLGQMRWRVL